MLYHIMYDLSFVLNLLNNNHKTNTKTQVPIEVDHILLKVDHVYTKFMSAKHCRTLDYKFGNLVSIIAKIC